MQDVARVMQEATQSGGVRPYGVSILVAGWDEGVEPEDQTDAKDPGSMDTEETKKPAGKTGGILKGGPSLYQVDPSGSYFPVESYGDRQERDECEDFPREEVSG